MPSLSEKQARFMRAVAHGWKPSRVDAPPMSVAREFMEADMKKKGRLAEMAERSYHHKGSMSHISGKMAAPRKGPAPKPMPMGGVRG